MFQRTCTVAISLLLVAIVACKKTDKPSADKQVPAGGGGSATAPTPTPTPKAEEEASDSEHGTKYDKPALTEAKIQGYIKSVKDGHTLFDAVGAAAGMLNGKESIGNAQAVVDDQEAMAKKYGFANFADYADTAGRIMLGEVTLGAAASMNQVRDMTVKSIADYEKQLADPSLTAEMKASLTDSLSDAKKSLADMDADAKSGDQLNAADLELVKKFKTEIEAAEKANAEMQKAKKK